MLLAFLMDVIVFFKSHRIDIDPENHEEAVEEKKEAIRVDHGDDNLL